MRQRFISILNYPLFWFICTGCCCLNPPVSNDIAPVPGEFWSGIPRAVTLPGPLRPLECEGSSPLAIDQLIDIGLKNNPLTQIAWQAAKAAAYQWKVSQSDLYPRIDFDEILQLSHQSFASQNEDNDFNNLGGIGNNNTTTTNINTSSSGGNLNANQVLISDLMVSFLLFDAGGRNANIESFRQALIEANWLNNQTLQDVILSIINSYYILLSDEALYQAKLQDLKDAKTNLEAAEHLHAAGIKTKVDVLRAQSDYVNTELQLAQIKGNIQTAKGDLATAIGIPANAEFKVAALPTNLKFNKIDIGLDDLVEIATDNRPDLAAAHAEYLSKKADVITAVSAGLPTLSVDGDLQHYHFIHNSSLDGTVYTGRLILNVPIFRGFFHVNQTRRAKALAAEALAEIEEKKSTIFQDVVRSYYSHTTAVETVRFSEEYLKFAQESYDAILSNYKEGVSTILDLLAVQGTLSTARSTRIQAKTQWAISLATLAHATGTLGNGTKNCKKMRSFMQVMEKRK